MIRILAVAVFVALVAALFLAPGVKPSTLATKQIADLLEEAIPASESSIDSAEEDEVALWKEIFASSAIGSEETEDGEQQRFLRMGGVRLVLAPDVIREGEVYDPSLSGEAGKAIVRRLRAIAANEEIDIRIDPFRKPDPAGANFLGVVKADSLVLSVQVDESGSGAPIFSDTPFSVGEAPGDGSSADGSSAGDSAASGALPTFTNMPLAVRAVDWNPITPRSLLPPLVAIFLAILLRRPVIALFAGVWVGAFLVLRTAGTQTLAATHESLVDVFDVYFASEFRDRARVEIVLFVIFMLAMVGILTKAGGIRGIMNKIARLAQDARRTQIATWFMGLAIFFDDYANTILVGSTMRPLADKFRIAREKLAYIVDSTAAPVAGVSLLSTWIAFEVSTFSAQLPDAGLAPSDGYAVFLQTLPYRFYCWFTLLFVGLVVFSGRDFGPMLTAERRARGGKVLRDGATPLVGKAATELEADDDIKPRASTALVPLFAFVATTLGMIVYSGAVSIGLLERVSGFPYVALGEAPGGFIETATGILYGGSGGFPLMAGAMAGFVVAAFMAILVGLRVDKILMAAFNSLRAMGVALVILYLAWMVGRVCDDLGTAEYLSATLSTATPYVVLPVALFLLSGLIAFSTGSSWSTMTILLPLVIGLTYDVGYNGSPDSTDAGARAFALFLMTVSIGAVLEGAIFGDHCSPISDTTVMSSIACASDHVDHVRTQAPYALLTMSVALGVGYFPVVFLEISPYVSIALGAAVLLAFLMIKGKRATAAEPAPSAAQVEAV